MSSAPDESRLTTLESAVTVLDLKVLGVTGRFTSLESRLDRLEAFRAEHVSQFQELHRDLRAALDAIHRLVDDRVPLKLLVERAVTAAERAERKAVESNTTSVQVLDRCSKSCVLAALHAQAEEEKKP